MGVGASKVSCILDGCAYSLTTKARMNTANEEVNCLAEEVKRIPALGYHNLGNEQSQTCDFSISSRVDRSSTKYMRFIIQSSLFTRTHTLVNSHRKLLP
jgi:hypothetical protein